MANKKNMPVKSNAKKPVKKGTKKVKRKSIFLRIGRFIKDVVSELKKVTWPTRKNLISYTIAVLVFVVIMMGIIYVIDLGAARVITEVFG